MTQNSKADPGCPCCQGTGATIENERIIDGEYWCSWVDCYCVPVDPVRADLLARLAELEAV